MMHFNMESFEAELNSGKLMMVDFWASWCGPCRMLSPVIESLDKKYEGKAVIGKVNVDEEQELAIRYGIATIPTLLVFENGVVTQTAIGLRSKEQIEKMLNK